MNRWLRIALQLISFTLFALLVWLAGPTAWQDVRQGDPGMLVIALALYGIAGIASASRLRLITAVLYRPGTASWRQFYQANWVARALGVVLPRSVSTIGGKSVALRSFRVPMKRAIWIVLVDNLFDIVLLGAFCVPAFWFLRDDLSGPLFILGSVVAFVLLGGIVWWSTAVPWTGRLLIWIRHIPWLARKLNLSDEQAELPLPSPIAALQALAWTLLLNMVLAFGFYFMAQAIHLTTSWLLFMAVYPFVQLSLIAAVTPGGLGIFDLGWLGLLALGGVTEDRALTFVVAQRAYATLFVLAWTGFSMLLLLTQRSSSHELPSTANNPAADEDE